MLTSRVVACVDVTRGRVVKGRRFLELRDVGDPISMAAQYEAQGADEIVFLDISATADARSTLLDVVERTASVLFIPLTVGGGVASVCDVDRALRAGADKVSMNSAAVRRPDLVTEATRTFGSQCVVVSIDAAKGDSGWQVFIEGGKQATALDAVQWAVECAARGAGEILLTSIDRDGSRKGYDLELTRAVVDAVAVPVIASGGAGNATDVCDVLVAGAQAALVAGILHDGVTSIAEIKRTMCATGLLTRMVAA